MKLIVAAFAAASLIATVACAGAPLVAPDGTSLHAGATPRYTSTEERLRGAPYLRSASSAHPADEITASERVFEFVPSASFILRAQDGGAFTLPR